MTYRPRPPCLGWPEQWNFEGGYAWLTPSGSAFVTQSVVDVATDTLVHGIQDALDELARANVPKYLPKFWVVHDWRSIRKVTAEARRAWLERTRRPGMPFKDTQVYIAVGTSRVTRMVLQSAALTIQLAVGQTMAKLIEDPGKLMEEKGVRSPSPEFLSTWRGDPGVLAQGT